MNIICRLRGHRIIRDHSGEPIDHFRCTRCGKRWFDPNADEHYGYCPNCQWRNPFATQP